MIFIMLTREQSSLARKINYLTDNRFVSGYIVEYDIKQANINMLYKYNIIDNDKYNYLSSIPKMNREIIIGNMIKDDKDVYKAIQDGIKESKLKLFETNNIQEYEVIRIANDAVYVNRIGGLKCTNFGNIEFVSKTISTCFLKLINILFFINFGEEITVDIKGLGTDYSIHEPLISIIVNIIMQLQYDGVKRALKTANDFIDDYIQRKLDVEYYRELNPFASYKVIGSEFAIYSLDKLTNDIDISYNLFILRELISILYEIYMSIYKRY